MTNQQKTKMIVEATIKSLKQKGLLKENSEELYALISKRGTIGGRQSSEIEKSLGGKISKVSYNLQKIREIKKNLNSGLSVRVKNYYKMGYKIVKVPEKFKEEVLSKFQLT